ncbi:MAG: general secretion pathway protein GspD [Bacteroidetes bacterium]|nr:general secretion pathway protein GspD [Bacteroidota bacterium]
MSRIIALLVMLLAVSYTFGQDRFQVIEAKLKELSKTSLGLTNKVEYSIDNITLQNLIGGLAESNSLNISVDNSLNTVVSNNFSGVTVADVLLFLCKKYDLDINFIGSIMSIVKYVPPVVEQPKTLQKQIKVAYNKEKNLLSVDLVNDSLSAFAKVVTKASGKNILISPDMASKLVNGYIQDMPLINAFEKLAFANNFKITETPDSTFMIEKADAVSQNQPGGNTKNKKADNKNSPKELAGLDFKITDDLITASANNLPIADVIAVAAGEFKYNYFFFSEMKGNVTMNVKNMTYEDFLRYVLNGTTFTFKNENGIYLFGDRSMEGLRATKAISLKYRTVEKVVDFIPPDLKKDVDIKTFPDLNSIILSGSQPRINEIEAFIRDIDKVVPVINIELIIAEVNKTHSVATGIEAGLGTKPATTGGTVFPAPNMTISAQSINDLLSGLSGFGGINLGNVTPNFYLNLKAMESNGLLKMHSTPKLATLNGHKATLSSGETQYYLETTNNIVGTLSPTQQISQQYKSTNASLTLTIEPMVSGDEQITLDIAVKQSTFTARVSQNAPPGTISRDFQSLIRVKNGDTVVLGGLDQNSVNDSGSGVPLLSRIPIIKWLFSSRTRAKTNNKLTVFIKATVIH